MIKQGFNKPASRDSARRSSFSLIEVVIATAVFATTIVAIIGLMAPMNRTTSHVLDAETGSRLIESIEAELHELGFDNLVTHVVPNTPAFLYATADGTRVLLGPNPQVEEESTSEDVNNLLDADERPGIAQRDRYFLVTLRLAADFSPTTSGSIPMAARIEWPYRLPEGPASETNQPREDSSAVVDEPLRHSFTTFYAITR